MSEEIKEEKVAEEVAEVAEEKPVEKKKSTKKSTKAEKVDEPAVEETPAKEDKPVKVEKSEKVEKVETAVKSFIANKAIKIYKRPSVNADYILFAGAGVVIEATDTFASIACKVPGQGGTFTGFVKVEDIK